MDLYRLGVLCAALLLSACFAGSWAILAADQSRKSSAQLTKKSGFSPGGGRAVREGGAWRQRRDTSSCGLTASDVLEMEPQELNEKAEAIQAVWVGQDEILIIASDKVQSGHSTVWRGVLKTSIGIVTFHDSHDAIELPVMADSLQVSPAGNRATVVVVALNKQFLFVSRDYGKTFSKYPTPVVRFDPTEELYLSSINPLHMVIRSVDGRLYVSDTCGRTWNLVTRNVQLVEFAQVKEKVEYMYYSVSSKSRSFNPLYRMDIASRQATVLDHSAYRFRVDNHYLFVSRKNATGRKEQDEKSRRLYVTNDYGSQKVQFVEVQLPSLRDEQFYVVMATHETGAFIHVYQGTDGNSGNLYVSDSSGTQFALSLTNHLYQVHQHPLGHYSVYDFYEVLSMRGVYITTVVDAALGGHVTMITFDNGGMWSRLTPPASKCQASDDTCSLHLHLRYSQMIAPFYNISRPKGPLSIKSAPMIILAHGTIGKVRKYEGQETNVYLSSDGGYTWKDAGLPAGSYVYGIADYGNIIAIAADGDHVDQIWFSHDRGDCFVQRRVDTTGVFQLSRGLLFDPSAASLLGYVMGVEGTGEDDQWRVVTLNFLSLLKRPCQTKDYTVIQEHNSNKNCLMGYRHSFNLTKASSLCYNAKTYNYQPVDKTPCPCDYSDYECGFGFTRKSTTECSRVSGVSLAEVCPPNETTYRQSSSGFRRIPGDVCLATAASQQLLSEETHLCTGHEQDSGIRVYSVSKVHHSTALTIFLAILLVLVSVLGAAFVLYLWLKCRAKEKARERVYYQRLPKEDKFSISNESSSDEDLITAT